MFMDKGEVMPKCPYCKKNMRFCLSEYDVGSEDYYSEVVWFCACEPEDFEKESWP